jgi:hypothetical protein
MMHRLPRLLVPTVLAVLLVAGLALPSRWAGILLLVPALFLTWLLALSWPLTSPRGRLLRVTAILVLFVMTGLRLAGTF